MTALEYLQFVAAIRNIEKGGRKERVQQISDVWVAGRHHVENGKLVHIDQNEIIRRTAQWRRHRGNSPATRAGAGATPF